MAFHVRTVLKLGSAAYRWYSMAQSLTVTGSWYCGGELHTTQPLLEGALTVVLS